ncbi:MAG: riboflavin synthase [Proteobacteria bacterium]|nr:MAG: riboflavin synthase [Pseudomonadota bacterium]
MFSGIVEEEAVVRLLSGAEHGRRLVVSSSLDHGQTKVGDSIAIDGVCLTVVSIKDQELSFDVAPETLRRSTLGELKEGQSVNLERSLKVGDRIAGHFVFGHVDCTLRLTERNSDGDALRLEFDKPTQIGRMLASKGSVSLSGVSLTLGEVGSDYFSVYIVPHTAQVTTLGKLKPGDAVNLEVDMLARYVAAQVGAGQSSDERMRALLERSGWGELR